MVSKENNFSLIHIIGAFLVVVGHMYILSGLTPPKLIMSEIHGIGVEMLFIVSGYLVSLSIIAKTKKIHKYYIEKIIRIYPSYIFCLFLTVIFLWFLTTEKNIYYWIGSKEYLVNNLLLKPSYYIPGCFVNNPYPYSINGSL